jgi:tRNA C32,U32 (ribose-2'-O)-methylase TrmJ
VLIFGNETDGLPARILEKHPEQCYKIPMPGDVRSLNLANAVSVVLYEGLRKLDIALPEGAVATEDSEEAPGPRKPARGRGRGRGKRT